MLNKEEFFNYVKANVGGYLVPKFHNSDIILRSVVKANDRKMTALIIRPSQDKHSPVPCIYLDDYYDRYSNGAHLLDLLDEIAECRNLYDSNLDGTDFDILSHYSKIRDKLVIKMCDPSLNKRLLQEKVYTLEGDLAAIYYLKMNAKNDINGMVAVDHDMLQMWDVSAVQLRKDAIHAELKRGYALYTMENLLCSISGLEKRKNLLKQTAEENTPSVTGDTPFFVLTRDDMVFGASAVMHEQIMDQACSVIGSEKIYVLPSSIHEVLLLPVNDFADIEMLTNIVKEVNSTQVAIEDLLSDKVQIYDSITHKLCSAVDLAASESISA